MNENFIELPMSHFEPTFQTAVENLSTLTGVEVKILKRTNYVNDFPRYDVVFAAPVVGQHRFLTNVGAEVIGAAFDIFSFGFAFGRMNEIEKPCRICEGEKIRAGDLAEATPDELLMMPF